MYLKKYIRRCLCYFKVNKGSTFSQSKVEMSAISKEEIKSKLKKMGEYSERLSKSLEIRFKVIIMLGLIQEKNIFDFDQIL